MYLGSNIRFLREDTGLSRRQLSEILGYKSYTTIEKWEKGVNLPPINTIVSLSELFDVSIERLVLFDIARDGYFSYGSVTPSEAELLNSYSKASPEIKDLIDHALHLKKDKKS